MDLPVGKGSIGKVGFRCYPVGKGAKRLFVLKKTLHNKPEGAS
jgi:hypothetical protein